MMTKMMMMMMMMMISLYTVGSLFTKGLRSRIFGKKSNRVKTSAI
jgi:hypothetical protein